MDVEGKNPELGKQAKVFLDLWFTAFEETFGERYVISGARDMATIKRLLKATEKSPEELMETARMAWSNQKGFNCKRGTSLLVFCSQYSAIRLELQGERIINTPEHSEFLDSLDERLIARGALVSAETVDADGNVKGREKKKKE